MILIYNAFCDIMKETKHTTSDHTLLTKETTPMKFDRVIAIRNTKTIYRDGNRCIKCFHNAYSKEEVLNEALNQSRMESTELHVPEVFEVSKINGKWSIIMEFIHGKTMEQYMAENPERIQRYLEQFVDLQILMGKQTVSMLPIQNTLMMKNIAKSVTDPAILASYKAKLDALSGDMYVCHGLLEPSNIIITDDGVPYLLDWMDASAGSIAADAAASFLSLQLRYPKELAEQYLHTFCQKMKTDIAPVWEWIPLVAASRLAAANLDEREYYRALSE